MDLKKIGTFLAQLRKEKGYTQEALGEMLGVTNKTVSRWENGNYLPPVEMLQLISIHYNVSINEILSGERLSESDYKQNAEHNLEAIIAKSPFSLDERKCYYKNKWIKEHITSYLVIATLGLLLSIIGVICIQISIIKVLVILASILAAVYLLAYNRMMAYIEKNAYDGTAGK